MSWIKGTQHLINSRPTAQQLFLIAEVAGRDNYLKLAVDIQNELKTINEYD
jgi:hypothetical protein